MDVLDLSKIECICSKASIYGRRCFADFDKRVGQKKFDKRAQSDDLIRGTSFCRGRLV
jgi:hypothetical protein